MSTPEELLAQILKANKKIAFGQTFGTNADGNCTVQTDDGSILARSPDQISAGSCVALKADDGQWYAVSARETGLVQKRTLFTSKTKPVEQTEATSNLVYLLAEIDSKKLFVSDGVDVVEINEFQNAVPDTFIGSISKTGENFEDWIAVGSYQKSTDLRYRVQFYITPDEIIEDDVKAIFSNRAVMLVDYFRLGDTVYTGDSETPIVVTDSNTAAGYITTKYSLVSQHFGHGWCYSSNTFVVDSRDESVYLFPNGEVPQNTELAEQFYARGGTNREKDESYYFGTYEGQPAVLLEDIGAGVFGENISVRFIEKATITIDPDTGAEIYPDLRGRTLQDTIYNLEYLGFTEETVPVVGGELGDTTFIRIFAYRMPVVPPVPLDQTLGIFVGSLNNRFSRSMIVETYFDQKQGVVKRKLYNSSVLLGNKEFDIWLDNANKITDTGRLLLAPATEDDESISGRNRLFITRDIGINWFQGLEQATQLYTRSTTLIGDADFLQYESIFVDEQGDNLVVDSRDYYEDPEDYTPFGLPSLLLGNSNLIGNVITPTNGNNVDITLVAPPNAEEFEEVELPVFESIYARLSESKYPNV